MWKSIEFAMEFKDEVKGVFGPRNGPDWRIVDMEYSSIVLPELREMDVDLGKFNGREI